MYLLKDPIMSYSPSQPFQALRITPDKRQSLTMNLADEVAIALSYGGTTHAVMMATPKDLEDFAIGFSLTEGLIEHAGEIENITLIELKQGIDVQVHLSERPRVAFQERRRHMAGPVGCGLCGIESIEAAKRPLPKIASNLRMDTTQLHHAFTTLGQAQQLNAQTRCAHAAGFYVKGRGLVAIREDIGRHNALDKLIGALLCANQAIDQGIVIVTSRLSVEMVQKAAVAGTPILAAVSAATAEAVRNGIDANMTLVARLRDQQFEIYAGAQRIIEQS